MDNDFSNSDELTFKELILKVQEYVRYIWTKKWWIILAGLVGAAIGFYRAYNTPINYTAELTFMVNEDNGNSLGAAGAILGQFGLGGGAASEYNLDKIVTLVRSRRIVQEVLFEEVELEGQTDYLVNHLIDVYNWHEVWEEDTLLRDFRFIHDSIAVFSLSEGKALKVLYEQVVDNKNGNTEGLLNASYQEETGILSLQVETMHEELAVTFTENLYEKLSTFYVLQSTEKQQVTVTNLQLRADSVEQILKQSEYQLARIQDRSQGFLLREDQVRQQQLGREVQVLTILLGEILKNLSTSEFLLKNATPFFQVVDAPILPLESTSNGYLKYFIIGSFLGGVLAVTFLFGRKSFRGIMDEK